MIMIATVSVCAVNAFHLHAAGLGLNIFCGQRLSLNAWLAGTALE